MKLCRWSLQDRQLTEGVSIGICCKNTCAKDGLLAVTPSLQMMQKSLDVDEVKEAICYLEVLKILDDYHDKEYKSTSWRMCRASLGDAGYDEFDSDQPAEVCLTRQELCCFGSQWRSTGMR